jgi:hypothetical protein
MTTSVVILNPIEPNDEMRELFANPLYSNRVTYVKGSTLCPHDLQKAKAREAIASFVLSSDHTEKDPSEVYVYQNHTDLHSLTLIHSLTYPPILPFYQI